ncbi:MAG TPA: metallophosphoesterase family protein [Gaiellaceae bacterium]|nr:metallophosphoesterase family protein [Gaiellaceae bacterium]
MRYGVLADVHGNLHALEAVLAGLRAERVDGYLCAGDLVGYGPFPNECVAVVAGLESISVAGNHDLLALGRLPAADLVPLARKSLEWTAGVLETEARAYLERLPLRAEADTVVVAHGSLDDPREYTLRAEQAARQLDRIAADQPRATILLLGHTHLPWAWGRESGSLTIGAGGAVSLPAGERVLLNPGSVGQSRERVVRARFLVLDLDRREAIFHAVPYDVAACREALRRVGLSPRSMHVPPSRLRRAARPLRRLTRRVRRLRTDRRCYRWANGYLKVGRARFDPGP